MIRDVAGLLRGSIESRLAGGLNADGDGDPGRLPTLRANGLLHPRGEAASSEKTVPAGDPAQKRASDSSFEGGSFPSVDLRLPLAPQAPRGP